MMTADDGGNTTTAVVEGSRAKWPGGDALRSSWRRLHVDGDSGDNDSDSDSNGDADGSNGSDNDGDSSQR